MTVPANPTLEPNPGPENAHLLRQRRDLLHRVRRELQVHALGAQQRLLLPQHVVVRLRQDAQEVALPARAGMQRY